MRRRLIALAGLAAYLAAIAIAPVVHQRRHARGELHRHAAGELLATPSEEQGALSVERVHHHFDRDLEDLGLSDAAHGGVAVVDCELARYTLATCGDENAPAHSFGDELIARLPHDHPAAPPPPIDLQHGAGSLEHRGVALLETPTFQLPPPSQIAQHAPLLVVATRAGVTPPHRRTARGPPALLDPIA